MRIEESARAAASIGDAYDRLIFCRVYQHQHTPEQYRQFLQQVEHLSRHPADRFRRTGAAGKATTASMPH